MALTLDHLVILVPDLDAAIADYRQLGFTVQPGGTHADGGTHNALVVFADGAYLELIAFLRPHPSHRWGGHAARGHSGFVDFALLPSSVGAVVADANSRGLAYTGPFDGGRLRPDGEHLVWQMGLPPAPELPFLCGDVTPRALRVPEGAVRQHPNGVTGVACITVAVADLETSLARYAALLGRHAAPDVRPLAVAGVGQRQALLPLGQTTLVLVEPGPDAAETSPLRQMLATRGEGVLGLALTGPQGTAVRALPRGQTHGAAFDIVPG